MRGRTGRGVAGGVGRHALCLKAQEQSEKTVRKLEDDSAVVEDGVVAGVLADVALIHVNVMNAVQAVEIAELGVDRLVQVLIELGAERVQLAAGSLALIKVERQQVLQIVAVRVAARRQHATEREVEERRLDVVERVVGRGRRGTESRREPGQRCQHRFADERVHDPERDVRSGVGLHVHRNPPRLPAVLEDANLQMWRGRVVFALVAVGMSAEHTVENCHATSLSPGRLGGRRHHGRGSDRRRANERPVSAADCGMSSCSLEQRAVRPAESSPSRSSASANAPSGHCVRNQIGARSCGRPAPRRRMRDGDSTVTSRNRRPASTDPGCTRTRTPVRMCMGSARRPRQTPRVGPP